MNQTSFTTDSRRQRRGEAGQAMLELAFVIFMMIVMVFGLVDFGRFLYEKQILVNLSREGANLASRGSGSSQLDIMSNAVSAIIASARPLDFSAKGQVIITAVTNSNNVIKVIAQVSEGGFGGVSKIGAVGGAPTLPKTPTTVPITNSTVYVAEVFYTYAPLTSLGKLMKFALPTTNYDAAYF